MSARRTSPVPRPPLRAAIVRLALVSVLAALLLAPPGEARAYGDLVFFGDSLTDTGQTCASIASSAEGFAPGRCSNGPVWADYLVADLGLGAEAASSASGGSNYAVGGAASSGFAAEIDTYLAARGGTADPDALHVVWLGGNDILYEVTLFGQGPDAMQQAAHRIGDGIESLAAAGARHFLVANAPDVGRVFGDPLRNAPLGPGPTPFSEAERAELTALSLEFNAALDEVLGGVDVQTLLAVDVVGVFDALIAEPAASGFSADAVDSTSQSRAFAVACLADPVCAADPQGDVADGYLVFDSVHPTTALHRLIADEALARLVPEPSTALCLGLGLALLAARTSRASGSGWAGRSGRG